MPNHEERIIRLEELLFFQEQRLAALDDALLQQQRQLDATEQRLADALLLVERLRNQVDMFRSQAQRDSSAELPPHYMPERY